VRVYFSLRKENLVKTVMLLSIIVLLIGCSPITKPSEIEDLKHPNEVKIYNYTQCYAAFAGRGEYSVFIVEKAKMYPCSPPHEGECPAKGWAMPSTTKVSFWGPWVRGEYNGSRTDFELSIVAAHEVGHTTGLWDEMRAELWATDAYHTSGCNS
jgi:hypothetical protein